MLDGIYQHNANVACQDLEDEVILYDSQGRKVSVLNRIAASIWRLLDGKRTVAEIVNGLCSSYQGDAVAISTDVEDLIRQLEAKQLIGRCSAGDS